MTASNFEYEHSLILDRANRLFIEKSKVRGQMWMDFPPSDKIRELRERITRIEHAYETMELETVQPHNSSIAPIIVSDTIDLINYAVFLIKQIERGQRG